MIAKFQTMLLEAKGDGTKKKYQTIVNKLHAFEEQYATGLPESDIHIVANAIPCNLEFTTPFAKDTLFLEAKSQTKSRYTFKFVNTRVDHVELNQITTRDSKDAIVCTREELRAKRDDLHANGVYCHWTKDSNGISVLYTSDTVFRVHTAFSAAIKEFETECGFDRLRIDHVTCEPLSKFILAGTHYTVASIDYNPTEQHYTQLREIDCTSSYATFKECRLYEGFPSKFTDLRVTDKIEGPGAYLIDNIKIPQHREMRLRKLGHPIQNMNVYARPILIWLMENGVTFDIRAGAWAGGKENRHDFEFPGSKADEDGMFACTDTTTDSKGNVHKGARYYSIWTGSCNALRTEDCFHMYADSTFARHVQHNCPHAKVYDFKDGTISVVTKKANVFHLSQITAYINAYEFIKIMDQMDCMDESKIVRIQKDAIIYEDHVFEMKPYMVEKVVKDFSANGTASCYLSNVWQHEFEEMPPSFDAVLRTTERRVSNPVEANLRVGGGGKTYRNLHDNGLINVAYISNSWKLVRAKQKELMCDVVCNTKVFTVNARALADDPKSWEQVDKFANVLLFDECSMFWSETAQLFMTKFPNHKIIFCGDPKYQIRPIWNSDQPCDRHLFDPKLLQIPVYYFNENRRVDTSKESGRQLLALLTDLRALMDGSKKILTWEEYRSKMRSYRFPPRFGEKTNGAPGPVAGRYFESVETNESLDWYKDIVLRAICDDRSHNSEWLKFACYLSKPIYDSVPTMTAEIEEYVIAFMTEHCRIITQEQALQMYTVDDMILVSLNDFVQEWTGVVAANRPWVDRDQTTTIKQTKLAEHTSDPQLIQRVRQCESALLSASDAYHAFCAKSRDKRQRAKLERQVNVKQKELDGAKARLKAKNVTTFASEEHTSTSRVQMKKYMIKTTDLVYCNGEIVVGSEPPTASCTEQEAFTVHSIQGETLKAPRKLFIDRRRMWELEHWYTALSRAQVLDQIYVVDIPLPEVVHEYDMYRIFSEKANVSYVGHTLSSKGYLNRFQKHLSDSKCIQKRKRCMSWKVLKHHDAKVELIEVYKCESLRAAKLRESHWMERTQNCVNRFLPSNESVTPKSANTATTVQPINVAMLEQLLATETGSRLVFLQTLESRLSPDGQLEQRYRRRNGVGRLYSEESGKRPITMAGCYKDIRKQLCEASSKCFDMVNAIPNLLNQLLPHLKSIGCKLNETDGQVLDLYCKHRKRFLQYIMDFYGVSRDDAKTLVLIVCYGGDPFYSFVHHDPEKRIHPTNNADQRCSQLEAFVKDMATIRDTVLEFQLSVPKYAELYRLKLAAKSGNVESARKSTFSIMTQELEAMVLDWMIEYCKLNQIAVHSLVYDAIIVENTVDDGQFIAGILEYVSERGFEIALEREW